MDRQQIVITPVVSRLQIMVISGIVSTYNVPIQVWFHFDCTEMSPCGTSLRRE